MNKKLTLIIGSIILVFAVVAVLRYSGSATSYLWQLSQEGKFLLPLVVFASLIDSINPCAFSILLLTIAFLFSLGQARGRVLTIGLAYIIGLFLIYILIGLGILQVLHLFNTPHFMAKVGAGLLVILGLINVINEIFPKFPIKLRIPHAAHHKMAQLMNKASLPTAFILGAFVGLCEFPCTGGPYLMVLGLLHDQGTYLKGFGYLILYNLVFILPLVLILLLASNSSVVSRLQVWQKEEKSSMRLIAGLIMVGLGLIIYLL